jgi:hypothetical protein
MVSCSSDATTDSDGLLGGAQEPEVLFGRIGSIDQINSPKLHFIELQLRESAN